MLINNLLSLHEAIVIALINQPNRTASFEEIAAFIVKRGLYSERKGIPLAKQVMLRSTKSKGAYHHLFEEIGAGYIRLRDSYADFAIQLFDSLEAILNNHRSLYQAKLVSIRMKDELLGYFRDVTFTAPDIICITTLKNSGEKKYIFVKERNLEGKEISAKYSVNRKLDWLLEMLDPFSHYLAMVSDSAIVNVAYFQQKANKELKCILNFKEFDELPVFKFSSRSNTGGKNYSRFHLIQEAYLKRTSFEKSILEWQNGKTGN